MSSRTVGQFSIATNAHEKTRLSIAAQQRSNLSFIRQGLCACAAVFRYSQRSAVSGSAFAARRAGR